MFAGLGDVDCEHGLDESTRPAYHVDQVIGTRSEVSLTFRDITTLRMPSCMVALDTDESYTDQESEKGRLHTICTTYPESDSSTESLRVLDTVRRLPE